MKLGTSNTCLRFTQFYEAEPTSLFRLNFKIVDNVTGFLSLLLDCKKVHALHKPRLS